MYKITLRVIENLEPCKIRFANYIKHYSQFVGDLEEFLSLENITETDKLWVAFRVLTTNDAVRSAALIAKSVLPIFEDRYPNDPRPRTAIACALSGAVPDVADAAAAANAAICAADVDAAASAAAYAAASAVAAAYVAADAANAAASAANAAADAYTAASAAAKMRSTQNRVSIDIILQVLKEAK